ncbi:MAG: hypothetical protein K9L30_18295 [Desulfobacterales bacterium]|nr:hypothetical protein [Desulfobacterales bacterium]
MDSKPCQAMFSRAFERGSRQVSPPEAASMPRYSYMLQRSPAFSSSATSY